MSRYIDADELLELYDINLYGLETDKQWTIPIEVVKQNIKDMPTADVEPVRHGRWTGKTYKCSICGKWIDPLQGDADMNYCPNCGARMDGKEDYMNG